MASPCAPWHCVRGPVSGGSRGRPFNGIVRHQAQAMPFPPRILIAGGLLLCAFVVTAFAGPFNSPTTLPDWYLVAIFPATIFAMIFGGVHSASNIHFMIGLFVELAIFWGIVEGLMWLRRRYRRQAISKQGLDA